MDLDKIKTFCLLIEHKTLVEVAKITKLSISGVQRQITSIEDELGVKLFQKQLRLLKPTPEGDRFYQHCLKLLDDYEIALSEVTRDPDDLIGELTISATTSSVASWLMEDLCDFIKENDKIRFIISADDEPIRFLKNVCDVFMRPLDNDSPEFESRFFKTFHYYMAASKEYLKSHGPVETIEDLAHQKIIVYGKVASQWYTDMNWHLSYLPKDFRNLIFINSGLGVTNAVENGIGIGVISDYAIDKSDRGLVKILEDLTPHSIDIYIIYPKNSLKKAQIDKMCESLGASEIKKP